MVKAESLIKVFFDAAMVHKPNMSSHQIHLYVLGLMAHELAFAFNNDSTVAQNVKELLEKLNPSDVPEQDVKVKEVDSTQVNRGQSGNQNEKASPPLSKIGSNLMSGLSYTTLANFLTNYPKVSIKDLRDDKDGLVWICGSRIDLQDENLTAWLVKNKFLWSKEKSAWFFSIV